MVHPGRVAGVIGFDVVRYRGTHSPRVVAMSFFVLCIGLKSEKEQDAQAEGKAVHVGLSPCGEGTRTNRIMEPYMGECKHTKVHVGIENRTDHGGVDTRQRSVGDKSP